MNKKKDSKVVPNVRFKGFTDDWKQRKLGDVSEIIGGGTPSTNHPEYWDGDIDWYSPAEISDQIYVKRSRRRITQLGYDNSSAKLLPPGTVLFTSRAGIGKTAILSQKSCTNQGFQSIVPHENELDTYFIFSRTNVLKRYGELVGAGSTFAEVSGKQMSAMNLMLPTTIQEQQLIGQFFKKLDCLITLHQQKITLLTKLKKAMLEKMFPKKGSVIPEIRFNGFANAWEPRKLGDIASSFEYGLNAVAKEYDGENKYIRITDIDDNTHEFLTDNLTSPDIELTGADNYKLTEGDILFARTGASVGKSYIYKNSDGLVYYAGFLIRARIKEEYDTEFVFQNTLTDRYNKYIAVTSQRSGQPGVNAQEYAEFEIEVPKKEEQTKIGTYFRNIDYLITLHQRKLDMLKKLKSACLSEMFI